MILFTLSGVEINVPWSSDFERQIRYALADAGIVIQQTHTIFVDGKEISHLPSTKTHCTILICNCCKTCRGEPHDFDKSGFDCVPPPDVLSLRGYKIDKAYREELYMYHPNFTCNEILKTFFGENEAVFPGQD
jgi:hypothetical protein